MNITEPNINSDISYSDNSHIFGIPVRIYEGYDGYLEMPHQFHDEKHLELLGEWIEKVKFLQLAGIEMHLRYKPLLKEDK